MKLLVFPICLLLWILCQHDCFLSTVKANSVTVPGIFKSCNDSQECSGENMVCQQNNCTCEDGYYYENDQCSKIPGIFEFCNDSQECSGENVECQQNNCTCQNGSYFEYNQCSKIPGIFEFCNDSQECSGENVVCQQNNCTCEDGYYYENDQCSKIPGIFESCRVSLECSGENVVCQHDNCTCKNGYYYDNNKCSEKRKIFESCHHSKECSGVDVVCKEKNCTCDTHLSYYENHKCHKKLDLGSECHFDLMCQILAVCKLNKCVCDESHYFSNQRCFERNRYGESCEANSCISKNMICRNKCTCKEGYTYIDPDCKKSSKTVIIIVIVLIIIVGFLCCILWMFKKKISAEFKPPNKVIQMELDIPRSRPILMSKFPETVDLMHKDSNKIFHENFLDLGKINPFILIENSDLRSPTVTYLSCHEAKKSDNTSKNRFLDILPFDHSRVKLTPIYDDASSDYINANYISGFNREKEYIAAQGPLSNTSSDFWRMVWEEKVSIIVMLTLCKEKEMTKCDNYWPFEKGIKLDFDDITVETTNVTNYDSYDYRSMIISIDEATRSLKHFHFLYWADFSANVPVEILINFVRNVRSHITSNAPVIVHCSAGVGRTGTFIAVDYMLQFVDANPLDSYIDIFQFVSKMRDNRVHMVQNKNQYILIHDCIKYAVKKKMNLETEHLDYQNLHENQGFVTIDLIEEKPSEDLDPEQMEIEDTEEEKKEEVVDLEEDPYENTLPANAEKDCFDNYDSDENPYDIPENAELINKNNEEKDLDDSKKHPSAEQKLVIFEAEEENPYENQGFGDADEKQMLTHL